VNPQNDPGNAEERLAELVDHLATRILETTCRLLALQVICRERGLVIPDGEVEAKMQEIELDATAEVELGPQYEEFRRMRDDIRRRVEDDQAGT